MAVGLGAGVRVHASHLWGKPGDIQAAFDAADEAGVALTYDMYSYRRSSTILASLLLPADLQADGPEQTLAALTDPERRAALLDEDKLTEDYLHNIFLGTVPEGIAEFAGRSVAEAAASSGQPAGEWVLDLLVSADLNVGGHLDRPDLTDADLNWIASNDRHCAGSDGIYQGQRPHPRGYAAVARLAQHYLAGGQDGWQRLARHLATNSADAYGLRDRGRVAPGMAADLCVIGPDGMTPHATYDAPLETATGVDLVLVNGAIAWPDAQPTTDPFPGQLVN